MPQLELFKKEKIITKEDIKKIKEKKIKLRNEKGFFILDRVKINYNFEADKYGVPHIEFKSAEENKPNLISETGYRSWFIEWDLTESVISSVEQLIEMFCEAEFSNKHPNYTLEFENKNIVKNYDFEKGEFKDDKDNDWNEINKLTTRCEKENEPYSYAFVKYNCKANLNGKDEYLDISDVTQRRREELGSSSGCGNWVTLKTKEDIKEFKEELLKVRGRVCEKPYTSECCVNKGGGDNLFLTDIKIKNTAVSFSKKAKEFLEKKGFSVDKFYREFNALQQKPATKGDIKKARTFDLMEKQIDKLRDECWAIKGYFEECHFLPLSHRRRSTYHIDKLKEFKIDISDLNKLKELYIKRAKLYKIFYTKVYFQRWGKMPEEEYTYP